MKRSLHLLAGLLALATVLPIFAADAPTASALKVGTTVPAVTLKSASGEPVDLLATVRAKPTVLIFFRGGWCPFCNVQLGALNEIVGDLEAAGYQLIAISPDRPEKLFDAPKRATKPEYTLLSDQDARAIDAFGISFVVPDDLVAKYKTSYGIDLEADSGRPHHKLPHPAVFVVDAQGLIRFAHVNPDYKARLSPAEVLAAARAAASPAPAM